MSEATDRIAELQDLLRQFAAERDWERYHTPRNLAALISSEAGELLALYRWGERPDGASETEVAHELADVFLGVLRFADIAGIDLINAAKAKITINRRNYPATTPAPADRPAQRIGSPPLRMSVNDLWHHGSESDWSKAADRYWELLRPENVELERRMMRLDPDEICALDEDGWYNFLHEEYFRWKYTAPNRLATTRAHLRRYKNDRQLDLLKAIQRELFAFERADVERGLRIAMQIRGLGPAGASGLLAVLFPKEFGTVDQFVVKALREVENLPEADLIARINPESIKPREAGLLVEILRRRAVENNRRFGSEVWTPKRIDEVLWTYGR